MRIDAVGCAKLLSEWDNIRIICHRDPDGDTIGSAMALFEALSLMGKRAVVTCSTPWPDTLKFIVRDMPEQFEPEHLVAVDVAAPKMILDPPEARPHVDLCIDHHATNPLYAENTFLVDYGSAGEAMYEVINALGVDFTPTMATALFTAMSSDTGGFRYSSVTSQTMRVAADLIDKGADFNGVRVALFESKTRGQIQVESLALANANYYADGRIAVISVTIPMLEAAGIDESELEGLASKTIEIAGVDIGITLKERDNGSIRVSVRSTESADSAAICREFDGGGHVRASGCRIFDTIQNAERRLVEVCLKQLEQEKV